MLVIWMDAAAVLKQLPIWMEDYNNKAPHKAPHKALNMLSPREYLSKLKTAS